MNKGLKQVTRGLSKNAPVILTGLAITGVVSTISLAIHATPKAVRILEEAMYDKSTKRYTKELKPIDALKHVWKCYVPTALMGAFTIGCIVSAHSVNAKRTAALAGLYSISEVALKEYKAQVVKKVGGEAAKEITEAVYSEKMSKGATKSTDLVLAGNDILCYDALSGRYFKSCRESIRSALNDVNHTMLRDDFVALNDLYYALGLPAIKFGEETGWSSRDGIIQHRFTSMISPEGVPCLVLDYIVSPKFEFDC